METRKPNVLLMADARESQVFGVLSTMQCAGYSPYGSNGQTVEGPVWWPRDVNLADMKRAYWEIQGSSERMLIPWQAFVFLSPTVSLPARNLTETLDISVGEIERTLDWLETVQGVDTLRFISVTAPYEHPHRVDIMSEQHGFLKKFRSGRQVVIRYHWWRNNGIVIDLPAYFQKEVLDFL